VPARIQAKESNVIRKLIAAVALVLMAAGCASNDGIDWWQKSGDPARKDGPLRGSGFDAPG
jgi:hypothetical protein